MEDVSRMVAAAEGDCAHVEVPLLQLVLAPAGNNRGLTAQYSTGIGDKVPTSAL
jgi:hypothetical protein